MSILTFPEKIRNLLELYDLVATDEVIHKLVRYLEELAIWNRRSRLVGDSSEDSLLLHLSDVCAGVPMIIEIIKKMEHTRSDADRATPISIADIGSGNGVVGIVAALLLAATFTHKNYKIVLIDRAQRSALFLHTIAAILHDHPFEVWCSDIKRVAPNQFDIMLLRAFANIDRMWARVLTRCMRTSGVIVCYKGKLERAQSEMEILCERCDTAHQFPLIPYNISGARHLLVAHCRARVE